MSNVPEIDQLGDYELRALIADVQFQITTRVALLKRARAEVRIRREEFTNRPRMIEDGDPPPSKSH